LRKEKESMLKTLESNHFLVSVMEDIKQLYEDIDYRVKYKVLNSAWYGSATKRERVIIVAIRNDIDIDFRFPKPTHMDASINNGDKDWKLKNLKRPATVGDALRTINHDPLDVDNIPMKHNEKTIARFKYIPIGKNIVSVMNQIPEELKISSFYSRGNTMRLDPNKPSPTLVPGHSNFPIHPNKDRSITVREAATITGFPINYKFFGSHTKRCEFVGNAVPVKLAEAVATSCKEFLDSYYGRS
jgi:DNA (cytosine-5)-methyltransferase 1